MWNVGDAARGALFQLGDIQHLSKIYCGPTPFYLSHWKAVAGMSPPTSTSFSKLFGLFWVLYMSTYILNLFFCTLTNILLWFWLWLNWIYRSVWRDWHLTIFSLLYHCFSNFQQTDNYILLNITASCCKWLFKFLFSTFSLSAFRNTIDFEYWKKILNFWGYSKSSFWSQTIYQFPQELEERRLVLEIWGVPRETFWRKLWSCLQRYIFPNKRKAEIEKGLLSTWGSLFSVFIDISSSDQE